MLFNSVQFLIFLPVVVAAYYLLPPKFRNVWLLAASYYFYMSWNAVYALLIFFSTLTTWICAGLVSKHRQSAVMRKSALACNIVVNLGILFTFKYYDMFTSSIVGALAPFGIEVGFPALSLLLPVGISFYTFQALGYSIDVYSGTIEHERNFLRYALFVSFFPQLVAGPIERSKNLLPQFTVTQTFKYENFKVGGRLMLLGFFKKVAIADSLAVVVDRFYSQVDIWPAPIAVIALVGFAIQLYCDFSAYSDIARGCARILGIKLMKNFDHPYVATSISDFWSRWHISLSTWFKDYLYIPLGGNRKGLIRGYINIFITFVVSGLWHGASFTFVIWGAIQGALRVIENFLRKLRGKKSTDNWMVITVKRLVVFGCWTMSLVFFRSETLSQALDVMSGLLVGWGSLFDFDMISGQVVALFGDVNLLLSALVCVVALVAIEAVEIRKQSDFHTLVGTKHFALRWGIYYALLFGIAIFGSFGQSAFIYFQF